MAGLTVGGFAAAVCVTAAIAHAGGDDVTSFARVSTRPAAPDAAATPTPVTLSTSPEVSGDSTKQDDAYQVWAAGLVGRVGVPARALTAYAVAAVAADAETPSCQLNWATLAGIGYVESRNGGMGGGLLESGEPRRPIYGVQLDGLGPVAAVPDTDGGRIDHDPAVDRAVGPLQFVPSTWSTWASDGDGDGRADPQDIDDAALAAGRYLCATGGLDTADGWTSAVLSYNHSADYLAAVFAATESIATRSQD